MNAEIRARAQERFADTEMVPDALILAVQDRRALLAHIDALTAKVEDLPGDDYSGLMVSRDAVIAILRGEA